MSEVRAGVFFGNGKFDLQRFTRPSPPPGGMLLQVEAVGMCGSDLAQLDGVAHVPGETSPVVPGHEIVGRIFAKADDCESPMAVGTRVAVDQVLRCGRCSACQAQRPHCENMRVYGYGFGLDEGAGLWGGYGEYMALKAGTHLAPLPENIPAAELTLFEPLSSAINWFDKTGLVPGETIVIQGPGHMGLTLTALARTMGAGKIVVTGMGSDRLRFEAALALGADAVVDIEDKDVREELAAVTHGAMADVVVDMAPGSTATIPLAVELARPGGRILLAGLKHFAEVEGLVSDLIVLKDLSVFGGAGMTPASHRRAAELLMAGQLPTDVLRGEVYTLDQLDLALDMLARKVPGKDAVRVGLVHQHDN
ncbi:MAG: alcohol dehydrogenase catalytic domain-containing protein [Deltaproteobacteria bacterium]|nr:alcohol dehydrogenase catalytic domain-containing protein [Deltaproteobacteria bacterium]MBW2360743.1 alcohol dehydrogenase catalytic domain-containing protein [Deltaproteobacteria bacterium]